MCIADRKVRLSEACTGGGDLEQMPPVRRRCRSVPAAEGPGISAGPRVHDQQGCRKPGRFGDGQVESALGTARAVHPDHHRPNLR
ncbi:hypothetical protein Ate02nite_60790 [Paractinoplanes tereljensis]|uniref:Uncharacterized protein n=1 Tax=Paractinoplanes tereljensis TaxID=571912 RepID=A0A919NQQ1_9ACTN|nr:hypothetical protein Ate02nite_60790 [Actinoplanes tereljensis]